MYIVSRANMLYVSVHRSAGGEQSIDISYLPRIMLLASQVSVYRHTDHIIS